MNNERPIHNLVNVGFMRASLEKRMLVVGIPPGNPLRRVGRVEKNTTWPRVTLLVNNTDDGCNRSAFALVGRRPAAAFFEKF
jgi:hypothetical protein